jgi:hypothetical protein
MFRAFDLFAKGFLPGGLFDRILGKAISWSQETYSQKSSEAFLKRMAFFRNAAVLSFGDQRFRMQAFPTLSCIRVDIEGTAALNIHDCLLRLCESSIKECMEILRCFSAVLCDGTASPSYDLFFQQSDDQALSNKSASFAVIPMEELQSAAEQIT